MEEPWTDWIPGALCKKQLLELIDQGYIDGADRGLVDHSALDLTLSSEGYELPSGCVKPDGERYLHLLQRSSLAVRLKAASDGSYELKARRSYLFKLRERLPRLSRSTIWGQATAKSSVGRMDVLARLIVDGMDEYESFDPERLQSGEMFVEITPMTFDVLVKEGISLVQLRLFQGSPIESRVDGIQLLRTVLVDGDRSVSEPTLSLDLTPDRISGVEACAFSVGHLKVSGKPIALWKTSERPKPWECWRLDVTDDNKMLKIENDRFYIIRSLERLRLTKGVAVYCRASDESFGEMRIHYAGFVHPFFGMNRADKEKGTPLIFEVRGHDVKVNLRHGEKMARLEFYRMSEDCDAPSEETEYDAQVLQLSKYFAPWPVSGVRDGNGFLVPRE